MFRNTVVILLGLLLPLAVNASTYIWSSAVPTQVQIVPGGLVLRGDFEITDVSCAGAISSPSIYLPKAGDDNFDAKVSLALTAFAAGKEIETLIFNNADSDCIQISAGGYVPKANINYWTLK